MYANLAFTDASSAVITVTVYASMLWDGCAASTSSKRTLVLSSTLLTALVECIAVQFGQMLVWNARQTMKTIGVLTDDVLQ